MNVFDPEELNYSIFDPAGNTTALVESPIDVSLQPSAADAIMQKHPEVEQVGFVRFDTEPPVNAQLRMAGGEFCGNASMCAAVLHGLKHPEVISVEKGSCMILLQVSGAVEPVEIRISKDSENFFHAGIRMPSALSVEKGTFTWQGITGELPIVRMEGIAHLIIEPFSAFYELLENTEEAEKAIRAWGRDFSCLGMMFLEENQSSYRLTPLVYVPGNNTVFWEGSCASGSAAAGMYLRTKTEQPVDLTLQEPGGTLNVKSSADETWLYGTIFPVM